MYSPKKCGIKYTPPTLVLIYEDHKMEKIKRRSIPLKKLTYSSDAEEVVENLYDNPRHSIYLSRISRIQIQRLVGKVIRELADDKPRRLPEVPRTSTPTPTYIVEDTPDFDLNLLDDLDLKRQKEKMNILFEKNKISQNDKDYEYDIDMDFEKGVKLESGWDSGDEVDF
ncbi:Centrosomal protein of 19 kDa [Oopsacas minuta]|uniref:Centrosomal protein of 19 kDa n=1 Tax=Oopsacas minuta TaxID=111878 RepID=A0AAV7KJ49_9METZ|nr:Centrosomal protein of 19 kDa [Oopsacas minuta]